MTEITRIPGQTPTLPGAVRAGSTIITSGVIHPDILTESPIPSVEDQASVALATVIRYVEESGGSKDSILKIEAFISKPENLAAWNEAYAAEWSAPGPARTTLVAGFAIPGIEIEIQATAIAL